MKRNSRVALVRISDRHYAEPVGDLTPDFMCPVNKAKDTRAIGVFQGQAPGGLFGLVTFDPQVTLNNEPVNILVIIMARHEPDLLDNLELHRFGTLEDFGPSARRAVDLDHIMAHR
jgi:hypothetical protein